MTNKQCVGVTGSRLCRALNATIRTSSTTISIAKTSAPGFAFVLQRERLFSRLDEGAPVAPITVPRNDRSVPGVAACLTELLSLRHQGGNHLRLVRNHS